MVEGLGSIQGLATRKVGGKHLSHSCWPRLWNAHTAPRYIQCVLLFSSPPPPFFLNKWGTFQSFFVCRMWTRSLDMKGKLSVPLILSQLGWLKAVRFGLSEWLRSVINAPLREENNIVMILKEDPCFRVSLGALELAKFDWMNSRDAVVDEGGFPASWKVEPSMAVDFSFEALRCEYGNLE